MGSTQQASSHRTVGWEPGSRQKQALFQDSFEVSEFLLAIFLLYAARPRLKRSSTGRFSFEMSRMDHRAGSTFRLAPSSFYRLRPQAQNRAGTTAEREVNGFFRGSS
jgi:hypothetical protein